MFSRLSQGFTNVLQELSGDEPPDGAPQDMLVPQLPPGDAPGAPEESGPAVEEEPLERLAHLEQLTVHLKEVVRDKDSQLATFETQLKSERETAEARFTKLKLQAKTKMAALNKQIADLKGQEGATSSPDSSFTSSAPAVEEELQELRKQLSEVSTSAKNLEERLQMSEQALCEKEAVHTEQVRVLQAVVCEKDVRFQEQIQKHEDELLRVTVQSQNDAELQQVQQALRAAQRRCEEQEEAMRSRCQVLEMLQGELNNADQQKQILTAQFRQMEQELAEAGRQREQELAEAGRQREEERQQWAGWSSQAEAELVALRANLEASEQDRAAQLANLEASEHDRGAQLASLEASERDRSTQMEELTVKLECATREREEVTNREVARLEKELAALREEYGEGQRAGEALAELLTGLRSLAGEGVKEDSPVPTDPAQCLGTLQALEARLERLRVEQRESEERCAQVTHTMETLQEQLDKRTAEGEEAVARIQQLEQQIGMVSISTLSVAHAYSCGEVSLVSALTTGAGQSATIYLRGDSLRDRDKCPPVVWVARESLVQCVTDPSVEEVTDAEKAQILALEQQLLEKDHELAALRESLVLAEEQGSNDAFKVSADQILDQSEDTAMAPCDSPTVLPDLLEDTREEDTTLVAEDRSILSVSADNESSPEFIEPQSDSPGESKGASSDEMVTSSDSEVAHSSWTLLEAGATLFDSDSAPGQVFAQALADELQNRYSELMVELQRLREAASESQERAQGLEEEIRSLTVAKDEAESQAQRYEEELQSARSEMDTVAQHSGSDLERQSMEMHLLEEQLAGLQTEGRSKEQQIQALQADLDKAQHSLSQQEGQARMLSAQLEEGEITSSELEQKLQDMEASLLEISQARDMAKARDTEINELQLRITQKEQEMMELSNGMSAKLLQTGEEKFLMSAEVKKLKEQIIELEKAGEKEKATGETLVQRKELMKKVAAFEKEADQRKGQVGKATEEAPASVPALEKDRKQEDMAIETTLEEFRQALRSKEEVIEVLEQKISQQDQVLEETLEMNRRLSEGAQQTPEADTSSEITGLQSQVASLESDCETLQKKLQEAQDSRKDTIRMAKEKDRHHREQLKQQKEEYNGLLERLEEQVGERDGLLTRLRELEELQAQKEESTEKEVHAELETNAASTIAILQTEVEDFKQFLSNKNDEIMELSQQLGEQSSLLQSMQETVYEKDQSIASLQEGLRAEKEKSQRLEAEIPQRQEEENGSEAKILQLQQKLKAALISRKEALKENKRQKEELASTEKVITELQQRMVAREVELEKLRAERERLIEEAESAKEEAARTCRECEEKVHGMKDEYETLLKSYENVSDEAERVRRVLEAARQERKELVARARTHEAAKQEAERQKEEAQKEVDTVKDKMRKFAKTKQQKIMDLEEENERLREMDEKKGIRREDKALKGELERLKEEFEALKADLNATTAQRDSLEQQVVEVREQLAQELEKGDRLARDKTPSSDDVVEETVVAQQSSTVMTETTQEPVKSQPQDIEPHSQAIESEVAAPEMHSFEETGKNEITESTQALIDAELSNCKAQLVEAQTEASQAQAERRACEQTALQREAELKAEAEQNLDSVRFRLGAELKQIELRLEESYREREREENATREAKELADTAERQAQQMQARLDESLARLAAFSRCMSSLQDDRDRVLDETRQWESRFNSTLQGKEAEVREGETRSRDLAEQLQKETAQREELQLTVDRLQKADEQWQLKWEQEEKRLRENQAALEQERGELQKSLAQTETSLADTRAQLASLESEAEGLRHRAQALEEAVGKLQGETNEARSQLKEREAEGRRLGLSVEQLETDLRSSKTLTESLQTELSEKERREVELLGEKEQAVTQAAEEARREADARAQEAEKELEERREEVRGLEDRLRKAEEESSHSKARLDAFTKAMGSLQDDRDRVLGMYKQLEEKHLQVMMEKDALIQEAAAENNSLKEELRSLLVQRDDLHAEKAKLSAQLHGYRDDLTQVLTMKESQHKQLLSGQLERIATLEKERAELEAKIKSLEGGEAFVQAVERETLSQAGDSGNRQVRDAPGAEVEKLREQLQAARAQVESLEESLAKEREVQEARQKELKELRWEGGVTRTESETAAERVAELARDLLSMEQRLLEEREVAGQLRAQNQAFGQAMASLQGSRDQALSQAQELSLRLEEMSRAGGQQTPTTGHGGSTAEVWGLKNSLSALQNDRERLLEQLQRQHSELTRLGGGELSRLSQELEEEKRRADEMVDRMRELDNLRQRENQELEILRLEQVDWQAQAELLKQQTLATLSDRDQQVRQLGAMLEEARATRPKPPEEHHQRQAPLEADLSSKVGVLQSESGPLNDLQLREQRITQLSNKSAEPVAVPPSPQLSQVFEENRHLSSQFQGSSQRLDEAESRCTALQRQLQELHEDKRKRIGEMDSAPGAPQQHSGPSESESLRVDFEELQHRYQFSSPRHPPLKTHTVHTHTLSLPMTKTHTHTVHTHVLSTNDQNTHAYSTHTCSLYQ
ncbi:unnamed protein product [Oncorhynchus mykiss]|uniref:Golgin B1 n=1 Tax=Oncorhynchus mykiss TaxID=8022 RepID=A0A060XUB4_ONCMY|nr:unnamed protein product [Oncorhynchus mykiss]